MSDTTKQWIAFGDIHQSTSLPALIPDISKADAVILTGDLTNLSPQGAVEKVWNSIYSHNPNIISQPGNMDRSNVLEFLREKGASLHCEVRELAPGVKIMGVGYSTPTPFKTPGEVSEEMMTSMLEETYSKVGEYNKLILAVHDTPYGTKLDVVGNDMHVGSKPLLAFIKKYQPDITICGHIHEARGEDSIGRSLIINPGMASEGGYVQISLKNGELSATLKQA
jgi:Icc-related predicted phosphoesterase